jgi:hypothetical protein
MDGTMTLPVSLWLMAWLKQLKFLPPIDSASLMFDWRSLWPLWQTRMEVRKKTTLMGH